jgi:hypothetical protein
MPQQRAERSGADIRRQFPMQHQSDEAAPASSTRKVALPANRRGRRVPYRETRDVTNAIQRLITALGKRVADGDPDELLLLRALATTLRTAESQAVAGLREQGHSDTVIARYLSVSRQAVEQRWPREAR